MENIKEDNLQEFVIDLGIVKRGEMNESFLEMFGGAVQSIMQRMFGAGGIMGTVRGTRQEINSFSNALQREKRYMDAYSRYGLDDPRTFKNKAQLDKAVKSFSRTTGISWPFK